LGSIGLPGGLRVPLAGASVKEMDICDMALPAAPPIRCPLPNGSIGPCGRAALHPAVEAGAFGVTKDQRQGPRSSLALLPGAGLLRWAPFEEVLARTPKGTGGSEPAARDYFLR